MYTATEKRKYHCNVVIVSFEGFYCPFIKYKNQEISKSIKLYYNGTVERQILYWFNFLIFRFEKKKKKKKKMNKDNTGG